MVRRERIGHPPRVATLMLYLVAGRSERAFIIGDLAEEFREMALDEGGNAASRWYWYQAVCSAGPLLANRLTSERLLKSLGAILVGVVTAIASATIFGGALGLILDSSVEPPMGVIAIVVTMCALLTSTCASCASTWVSGGPYRWALAFIGLVVVAPEIIYAVWRQDAHGLPLLLVPLSLAVLATYAGLVLGGRLGRTIRFTS